MNKLQQPMTNADMGVWFFIILASGALIARFIIKAQKIQNHKILKDIYLSTAKIEKKKTEPKIRLCKNTRHRK